MPRYDTRELQFHDNLGRFQTTNLIINMDHDEWIFDDDARTLAELGIGEPVERIVLIPADVFRARKRDRS